jgi:flagellar motor switch/type III secretory pathway protein FliN
LSAAQPWSLLGASDREGIARGVQPLLRAWADEWLPDALPMVSVVDAHAHPAMQVQAGEHLLALKDEQGGLRAVAIYGSGIIGALQAQTLAALGMAPVSDSIHAALAQYQLRDLLARLVRLPAGSARRDALYSHDRALRPAPAKGSGTALLLLTLERDAMRVWLPQDAIGNWRRRPSRDSRPALFSRTAALSERRLSFQLQAGGATLALADLLTLQPGTVIRLDSGLDQPMELVTEGGAALGRCYLGLQHGRPVIQFCA